MGTPRSRHRSWRRGAPLLLVVLGGLIAMHGLGSHGAAHHTPVAHSAVSAHAEHTGHPAPAAATVGTLSDGSLSGYAALCLALLTAVSVLGRRASRRGLAMLVPRAHPPATLVWPVTARRDRDPPSLTRLSINRC